MSPKRPPPTKTAKLLQEIDGLMKRHAELMAQLEAAAARDVHRLLPDDRRRGERRSAHDRRRGQPQHASGND